MKRLLLLVVFVFLMIATTGCIYTRVTLPYTTELNKTELGNKQGTSSFHSVLWLFAWGDAGAAAAAKKGDITTLRYMDREFKSVFFGIYSRQTTIVYGD